jgi:phosphohistidine swiveling domain-containing protein
MTHSIPEFGYNPLTGERNDSLAGDYLWSSVNTREASPDVVTPYTWSTLRHGVEQMILLPGYLSIGNICGRAYNNASVGETAMRALGVGKTTFNASSKELYGFDPATTGEWDVPLIPISIRERVLVLRNVVRLMNNTRRVLNGMQAQLAGNPAWCKAQHDILPTLDKDRLHAWAEAVLQPYLVQCFWWMVGSAMAQSNLVSKLRRDLLERADPDDTIALLSNVSSSDDFLASLGPVAGLDRVRRGLMNREAYLQQYGHRGPHEVELSFPRSAENPDWIDEQLEGLEQSPSDVDTLLNEQRGHYEAALARLQKSTSRKFDLFLRRIKEAARLTRLREAGRSESIRALWVSRNFALRAGALNGIGENAFFLEYEEIIHLLEGSNESLAYIPARQAAYQKYAALPLYPTIIMGRFDPIAWAADPNRRTDIYDAAQRIKKRFTTQIKGLPGSAGYAEGRVRILHTQEEGRQLQPGEILVATTTNVGWTPIFPRAAAVVTDVGAPLSHAAIVARELGIPAVVGCFNATALLKTGDRVRVDGTRGIVELLDGS